MHFPSSIKPFEQVKRQERWAVDDKNEVSRAAAPAPLGQSDHNMIFLNHGLDDFTDTVTSYINFVENSCIPSKSVVVFNNNKPWFN